MKSGSMLRGYRSRKHFARIVRIELFQGHVMWPTSVIGSHPEAHSRGQGRTTLHQGPV